jgi:SNF2 family DNA or RNA helicase
MIQWERESTIRVGVLADEMSLGKTLTTLAVILANPPAIGSTVLTTVIVKAARLSRLLQPRDQAKGHGAVGQECE